MKRDKIIYYVATGLFTLMMLGGVANYFFNYQMVVEMLNSIGHPPHIIYPLAVAKLLGLVAIWTNKSKVLKEWAYAGFTFTFILAMMAHGVAQDGGVPGPAAALVLALTSYFMGKRIEKTE